MTIEQEHKLKSMAEQEARLNQGSTCASSVLGSTNEGCCLASPSLRERIRNQSYHAKVESRRVEQLQELEFLLDKNPEVARILDLLESVR